MNAGRHVPHSWRLKPLAAIQARCCAIFYRCCALALAAVAAAAYWSLR